LTRRMFAAHALLDFAHSWLSYMNGNGDSACTAFSQIHRLKVHRRTPPIGDACLELAVNLDVSLRDLDRALWRWHETTFG
jgi:hypothetical protein